MQWKPQTTPVHAVLLLFVLLLVWHSKLRTVKDNTMIKEGTCIDGSQQFKTQVMSPIDLQKFVGISLQ